MKDTALDADIDFGGAIEEGVAYNECLTPSFNPGRWNFKILVSNPQANKQIIHENQN